MLIIEILLFILLILILFLLKISIKNKKNIGQKIGFLYNDIYRIMITDFYNVSFIKKNNLRLEIISYYKDIILCKNIKDKYKKLLDFKKFMIDYYGGGSYINKLLDDIENYTNSYYKLISNNIIILLFVVILILVTLLLIIKL